MTTYVRANNWITREQDERLKILSHERRVARSVLMREALDAYLKPQLLPRDETFQAKRR